jgi:hypothetical protein
LRENINHEGNEPQQVSTTVINKATSLVSWELFLLLYKGVEKFALPVACTINILQSSYDVIALAKVCQFLEPSIMLLE